jgi:hypothetical protein
MDVCLMSIEIIQDLVNRFKKHTILDYEPDVVVVDVCENVFLKLDRSLILELPIKLFKSNAKMIYIESFPESINEPEVLEAFACEVVFYLSAKLSGQEILKGVNKNENPI